MKTTYAVMPIGDPVRFIDGASAARRTVKTTLRNLKRWYTRLRRRTTVCVVDFKSDRQNCTDESKVPCGGNTKTTMIVDQEESRNRTNENLENELKEILVNNGQSEMHGVFGDDDDYRCQTGHQRLDRS